MWDVVWLVPASEKTLREDDARMKGARYRGDYQDGGITTENHLRSSHRFYDGWASSSTANTRQVRHILPVGHKRLIQDIKDHRKIVNTKQSPGATLSQQRVLTSQSRRRR